MSVMSDPLWLSLPVPAVLIDVQDRIEAVNPPAETFLNASARQVTGQPVFDVFAIDAAIDEQASRVRMDGAPLFLNDVDVGSGQSAPVNCNIRIAPFSGQPGALLMLVESRVLAERLGRSLSVKSAAKSAVGLSSMLAHEIKNPLAGITGAAQLLAMGLEADDLELTDLIVDETRRILSLLENVEQFGNLAPPAHAAINIHDLLDRARKSAVLGFAAHMTFVEEYDPSLPPTWVDADQMVQAFLNLLKNAAEATKGEAGQITIRTFYDLSLRLRQSEGAPSLPLIVEIIDDGPGLPPDIAADIFDPFVSGRENGTGLGLAMVSKIMTDHEGWISVDSVPGRTVFRIALPMVPRRQATGEI